MSLICQSHTKVDSIIISILDNKYILLAPPSGRILRKKGKREWFPFFRLTGGTPKRKVPADRRGQQGLVKEREQQAFSRVKSKSLLNGAYPAYLCSRNSHRGEKRPRRGRISGCLRSRRPARSTVCRGRNTSRRSGDFRRGCGASLKGRCGVGEEGEE